MIKQIRIWIAALLIFLIPAQAWAASYGSMYYVPYLDQYRLDYAYNSADVRYELVFTGDGGQVFTGVYNFPPTGIHYLTCNGDYRMNFYNSAGQIVHTLGPITTSMIRNPTCSSYADGVSGKNDLNAKATQVGDNDYKMDWGSAPGAVNYQIWKDGQLVGSTPGNTYETGKGSISIVALDENGNVVGQSDLILPKANSECCQFLSDLLSCPDWDKYMGELSKAVHNGLPTLPEWRTIADQFVDAFDKYLGPVPDPPTVDDISKKITPGLPKLDTDVPKIEPAVPDDFKNGPIPFDITKGPEIPVVDESQPIEIYEPNKYIKSDPVGEMVFPGDPRNHSDGIKQPDKVETPYMIPVPTKDNGSSTIPPSDMPVPSGGGASTMPIPNGQSGPGPIPGGKGG